MNIIKSEIIETKYDIFWDDAAELIGYCTPKSVLVIVCNIDSDDQDDAQLRKMLEAGRLQPGQYNIIKLLANEQVAWHKLRERLKPKVVFLLGIMPAQLGISSAFRLHEPNNFGDCIWLPALSIAELGQNPSAKSQLWSMGMKPIFVDKKYGEL
jgi:hypothetical protein